MWPAVTGFGRSGLVFASGVCLRWVVAVGVWPAVTGFGRSGLISAPVTAGHTLAVVRSVRVVTVGARVVVGPGPFVTAEAGAGLHVPPGGIGGWLAG
ncbi:hypothetical protein DLJ47_14515 [Micromonospora sp. S4605]|nr:hypothetical protein DLJ47_14515 [Micromonospora sp. S4605]